MMNYFPFVAFLIPVVYLLVVGGILFLINTWVNRSINVKKEQNNLLRELIQKIDTGTHKPA
jgi:ABC-type bacteriocin/lantibiotic exporter with double-glycine peptidase domain